MSKTWQNVRDEVVDREYGIATTSSRPPAHKTEPRERKEPTFRPPDYGDHRPADPVQYFGCNVAHDV